MHRLQKGAETRPGLGGVCLRMPKKEKGLAGEKPKPHSDLKTQGFRPVPKPGASLGSGFACSGNIRAYKQG
jgi:hypothetical protein